MLLGQDIPIFGHWFIINFTENYGMAFGLRFGGDYGKLMLSLFRILAVGAIGYYLYTLIREKANFGFVACISLIFAGAMGNIIDSAFMVYSLAKALLCKPPLFYLPAVVMEAFCTVKLLICFTFLLFRVIILPGFLFRRAGLFIFPSCF